MHHLHTRKQFKQGIKIQKNSWSFVLQTSKSIRRLVQASPEILLNSEEVWISRLWVTQSCIKEGAKTGKNCMNEKQKKSIGR